jgi:hypothetical protein
MPLGINMSLFIGPTAPLPAPSSIIDAIKTVEVTNTDEGRDGFQIIFSAGRSSPADILDYPLMKNPLIKPFNRIVIMITLGAIPKVLIDGIITHIQLNPSNEPGESTLTITGEDVSVMMDMEEKSQTFPTQPDDMIVFRILGGYTAKYGIIPNVIPPQLVDVPLITDRIPSQHSTDLSYIMELARLHTYIFYIEPQALGVNKAYWGPPNLTGIPQKALSVNMGPETNINSINFRYNALKPSTVEGSFQDRMTNVIQPVMTFASTRPPISSQPAWFVNKPNVRVAQFRESGLSAREAFARAQAETDKQSSDILIAEGEIDSIRYGDILQARKLVGIRGAGNLHDGIYYVKRVTHNINVGEYNQSFTLVREGFGSTTPVVPT